MSVHVWAEDSDAATLLATLGVSVSLIHDAHRAGLAEYRTYTENDMRSTPGAARLSRAVRVLSEQLKARGWIRTDPMGLPLLTHPDLGHAVTVTSGDAHTGSLWSTPRTRNPKGPMTQRLVNNNRRHVASGSEPLFDLPDTAQGLVDLPTWMLLLAEVKGSLVAELSLPNSMAGSWITGWHQRILIPPLEADGVGDWVVESGPMPDYDFEVTARDA